MHAFVQHYLCGYDLLGEICPHADVNITSGTILCVYKNAISIHYKGTSHISLEVLIQLNAFDDCYMYSTKSTLCKHRKEWVY